MSELSRRGVLMGLAAMTACSRRGAEPAPAIVDAGARGAMAMRMLEFDRNSGGPATAALLVPTWGEPNARYPLVVALHGRGEAVKAPAEGALGWPRDYALTRAIARIASPPLTATDLEGMVDASYINDFNRALQLQPFGGLIVVCPHVPDLTLKGDAAVRAYGRFIVETLIPRVRREAPVILTPEATGIDGVSLGGALSLRIGLAHPEVFGAVDALQPAIGSEDLGQLVEAAIAARMKRPSLKLRLVTSTGDYFRPAVEQASKALHAAGVAHGFLCAQGPHDYAFNRGPGSYELLRWNDRALRGG